MFIGAIAQRFSRKLDGKGKYMYGEDREENVCTQSNRNKKICSPQRGLYKGQHDMILCMQRRDYGGLRGTMKALCMRYRVLVLENDH